VLVKTLIRGGPPEPGIRLFSGMNFLDLLILIPAIWGFWRGFTKGVIMEVATLAAFFVGVWGGIHLSDSLASLIRGWMGSQSEYIPLVAFALVFVGILMAVYGVAKLVDRVAEKAALGIINKIAGGAFGGFKFVLVLSVLFFVLDAVQKSVPLLPPQIKEGSLLYGPVSKIAPAVIPGLTESNLGEMIPKKEDVEVDVDVNLKLKDSTKKDSE
jgi:membrane protein required for colicin V production